MSLAERLDIKPELDALTDLSSWAELFCERHELGSKTSFALQLCLEEAVSNVIRHAGLAERDRITVALHLTEARLTVDIADPGVAFNPLEVAKPDAHMSLEEAAIGGQGIELMRRFCQSMSYRREHETNVLQVALALPAVT